MHKNNIYGRIIKSLLIIKKWRMIENIYSLEIFKWIDKNTIDNIVNNCPIKKYKKWELILIEWEISNWEWYIIKSWKIEISINWKKITELQTGDIFWEIALLNEEQRTATVTAFSDIETIVLSLDNLIEMINNDSNNINKTIMKRIEENIENE